MAWLGNARLMHENDLAISPGLAKAVVVAESQARSLACVGWAGRVRGIFLLHEEIRTDAQSAVARCRKWGLHVCLLTGDHRHRARALADLLGIDVEAEQLPGDKLSAMARLRDKWGAVTMVGDGINDSPALAAADVGIAMGCGADVSRQSPASVYSAINSIACLTQSSLRAKRCGSFDKIFFGPSSTTRAASPWHRGDG